MPYSVLILNDDAANNAAMRWILRSNDIPADSAETVEEAEAKLSGGSYGLLICRYSVSLGVGIDLIGAFWKRFGVPGSS